MRAGRCPPTISTSLSHLHDEDHTHTSSTCVYTHAAKRRAEEHKANHNQNNSGWETERERNEEKDRKKKKKKKRKAKGHPIMTFFDSFASCSGRSGPGASLPFCFPCMADHKDGSKMRTRTPLLGALSSPFLSSLLPPLFSHAA